MNISELRIGQHVQAHGHDVLEVIRLGRCYWPGCKYGDDCVEVRTVGKAATRNYRASQLEPLEAQP